MSHRIEKDFLGAKELPDTAYCGVQTLRRKENFHITGIPMSLEPSFVKAFGYMKKAAGLASRDLGVLDQTVANGANAMRPNTATVTAVGCSASSDVNATPYSVGVRAALRDGTPVCIRAIRSDDKERLRSEFERLSPESVYHRFFHAVKTLTPDDLRQLTELDFRDRVALVLTTEDEGDNRLIGVARFARLASGADRAEMAIVIADAYQHRGAGTLLLEHLVDIARAVGVRELLALVLEDNQEMLELLRTSGLPLTQEVEDEICDVVLSL